ncbi:MAG: ABC transporter ATP-binding protein, partial [Clostridia bacterium]|nr:ABC transporter ATP-binding protein [Clostridia bacterium]
MAARTLEALRKQYNGGSSKNRERMRGGFGGRRGPQIMGGGKPANTGHTIHRLFGYVGAHKGKLIMVLFCMLMSTITSLMGSYLLMPIINRLAGVSTGENAGSLAMLADRMISALCDAPVFRDLIGSGMAGTVFAYLLAALLILTLVYLIGLVTTYLQGRLMLAVSQHSVERIRNDLFAKLQTLPVRFFDTHATGEVMSRFTNDVDNIDVMMNNSLVQIVSGIITIIGTFTFMVTTNWQLTLVTLAFVPIYAKGGALIGKKSHKYYSGQQAALGAVNGYIEETVSGQKVIKVFNHEDICVEEFGTLNDDLRDKQFYAQFFGGIMGPVMGNMAQVCYGVTLGIGAAMMVAGGLTPGALTVFANYSRHFGQPINTISMQISTIFAALAGAERVFQVMDADPETPDEPSAKSMDGMKGYVKLEHVSFGYVENHRILNDISLYAKPGQKIALVGSTGAGKTTITNLLNRFY